MLSSQTVLKHLIRYDVTAQCSVCHCHLGWSTSGKYVFSVYLYSALFSSEAKLTFEACKVGNGVLYAFFCEATESEKLKT